MAFLSITKCHLLSSPPLTRFLTADIVICARSNSNFFDLFHLVVIPISVFSFGCYATTSSGPFLKWMTTPAIAIFSLGQQEERKIKVPSPLPKADALFPITYFLDWSALLITCEWCSRSLRVFIQRHADACEWMQRAPSTADNLLLLLTISSSSPGMIRHRRVSHTLQARAIVHVPHRLVRIRQTFHATICYQGDHPHTHAFGTRKALLFVKWEQFLLFDFHRKHHDSR